MNWIAPSEKPTATDMLEKRCGVLTYQFLAVLRAPIKSVIPPPNYIDLRRSFVGSSGDFVD